MAKHTVLELEAMNDRDRAELLSVATDRFERRLSDEGASLRESMAGLRVEIAEHRAETRQDIADLRVAMAEHRAETKRDIGDLRVHMTEQFAASEQRHHELLKWAFVFWVGQAVVMSGLYLR